jgi:Replication initiator protein, pSAM2
MPGRWVFKAHDREHLGLSGRRVLVSREWSGETLAEHRADRAAVERQRWREQYQAAVDSVGQVKVVAPDERVFPACLSKEVVKLRGHGALADA